MSVLRPPDPRPDPSPRVGPMGPVRMASIVAVLVVAVLIGASACTGAQKIPSGYGDTTSENFQEGCVATSTQANIAQPAQVCRCAYDGLVADVPFDEFKDVYSDLQDDRGPLPAKFVAIMDRCVDDPGDESVTSTTGG